MNLLKKFVNDTPKDKVSKEVKKNEEKRPSDILKV